MRIVTNYTLHLLLVAVFAGISNSRGLVAQEVGLPQQVSDALSRFGKLDTFALTWTEESRKTSFLLGKLAQSSSQAVNDQEVNYLVWQNGKLYLRRIMGGTEWKNSPNIRRDEFAYNGRIFAGGCPDESSTVGATRHPGITIDLAADLSSEAEYFGVERFEPLGIHMPRGMGEVTQGKPLASQILFLLEHGGRLESTNPMVVDGRPGFRLTILVDNPRFAVVQRLDLAAIERTLRDSRTNTEEQIRKKLEVIMRQKQTTIRKLRYEYDFISEFGYAVSRWRETTEEGSVRAQSYGTDHQKLAGYDIWIARKWRTDIFIADSFFPGEIFDTPTYTKSIDITKLDTSHVSDNIFTLNYTIPGTNVKDNTLTTTAGKKGVSYIIPARPEDLDKVIQQARSSLDRKPRSNAMALVIVGNAVCLAVLIYVVVRRKKRANMS